MKFKFFNKKNTRIAELEAERDRLIERYKVLREELLAREEKHAEEIRDLNTAIEILKTAKKDLNKTLRAEMRKATDLKNVIKNVLRALGPNAINQYARNDLNWVEAHVPPVVDIFCGDCISLNMTERQQDELKYAGGKEAVLAYHYCNEHDIELKHGPHHPEIMKCEACMGVTE